MKMEVEIEENVETRWLEEGDGGEKNQGCLVFWYNSLKMYKLTLHPFSS